MAWDFDHLDFEREVRRRKYKIENQNAGFEDITPKRQGDEPGKGFDLPKAPIDPRKNWASGPSSQGPAIPGDKMGTEGDPAMASESYSRTEIDALMGRMEAQMETRMVSMENRLIKHMDDLVKNELVPIKLDHAKISEANIHIASSLSRIETTISNMKVQVFGGLIVAGLLALGGFLWNNYTDALSRGQTQPQPSEQFEQRQLPNQGQ